MNDRIKELALRANMEYDVFLPDAWTGESKDLEKFAELIINECVKYLKTTDFSEIVGNQNDVAETAAEDLQNLFGIE